MKITALIPCLMLDNNRAVNRKFLVNNISSLNLDNYAINDQCFSDQDYEFFGKNDKITFIGNHKEKQGFVKTRNQLLDWFYNSDYDYALWIDANSSITKTTMNAYYTIINAIREEKLDIDAMFSSLGIITCGERMKLASQDDYLDFVKLLPCDRYSIKMFAWLHCCLMKNVNKYYGDKLFIDSVCDPYEGISEDIYLSSILRQLYDCYLCPSICVSKPRANTSTWMNKSIDTKGVPTYGYPPVDWGRMQQLVSANSKKFKQKKNAPSSIIELPRVEKDKNLLRQFKSRKKTVQNTRCDLF